MTVRISYTPNKAGLDRVLRNRNGPVQLYVANKGREVEGAARRRVGVDTGRLKRSIGSRLVPSPLGGYNVEVFASAPYAKFHHDGTRPHRIDSAVFITGVGWRYIGMHPGTSANRFLLEALRDAGLDRGRRFTT